MKKIVLSFAFCLISFRPASSQTTDWESAFRELAAQYEECQRRLAMRDSLIQVMRAALDTAHLVKENTDGLLANIAALNAQNDSLVTKYERMITLSDSIQALLGENLTLSQRSVAELDSAMVDLNRKYNRAVRECLRPWYRRWEFYMGGVLGGLISWVAK